MTSDNKVVNTVKWIIMRLQIDDNKDLIRIGRNIENGTIRKSEKIDSFIKGFRISRRGNHSNNGSRQGTRKNGKTDRLHTTNVGWGRETRQGQNSY